MCVCVCVCVCVCACVRARGCMCVCYVYVINLWLKYHCHMTGQASRHCTRRIKAAIKAHTHRIQPHTHTIINLLNSNKILQVFADPDQLTIIDSVGYISQLNFLLVNTSNIQILFQLSTIIKFSHPNSRIP